jgi:hypothetical protein
LAGEFAVGSGGRQKVFACCNCGGGMLTSFQGSEREHFAGIFNIHDNLMEGRKDCTLPGRTTTH